MTFNVLVACEESQAVCTAFRRQGARAFSCDLQECSGGHPEWHIRCDVRQVIDGECTFNTMDGLVHRVDHWDLIIAHPPCTYLSNAGAKHLWRGHVLNAERYALGLEGKALFMACYNAPCAHVCVENPIPSKVYELPRCTQYVQPYEYGHPYSKRTCLWLRGLPALVPTDIVAEHVPYITSGSYTKSHDPRYKGTSRAGGAAKMRSKTFTGIADAMATQWMAFLKDEHEIPHDNNSTHRHDGHEL